MADTDIADLANRNENEELPITESSKYYARIQTVVACGLGLPAGQLAGHHTDAASKHSFCYFSSFSE